MTRALATAFLFALGVLLTPALQAQTTVNHLTMNQWVQIGEDGSLKGRVGLAATGGEVAPVMHVNVAISRNGIVRTARANSNGEFVIRNVEPGVYALTARGKNVFGCCAMHVVDADQANGKFPTSVAIALADVDYTVVNTAVIRYLPPNAQATSSIESAEFDSLASQVCGSELFRVARSAGGMTGYVHLAGAAGAQLQGAGLTNVFIYKDGSEVARALTDETGYFAINRIKAGRYSLLAIGPGGIGLVGFELVDRARASDTASTPGAKRFVQVTQPPTELPDEFAMQVAPMPEVVDAVEQVDSSGGQCITMDGPVTVTEADGTSYTSDEAVSFIVDGGEQSISTADGQTLYENVQVVDSCPDEVIEGPIDESMIFPEGEIVMDGFGSPVPGGGFTPTGGTTVGGGGGGAAGGGGLGGLGAVAAVGAAAAAGGSGNNFGSIVIASPATP